MKHSRLWVFVYLAAVAACSPAADAPADQQPVNGSGGSSGGSNGSGGSSGTGKSDASASGGSGQAPDDAAASEPIEDAPMGDPTLLSQTGLYSNTATGELAPDVVAYQPQFALWSDGATKRRWVKFPAGQKIDTSDMDFWQYPVGIKFFKEFTRDGVRVETRMIWKRGIGDWFLSAYKWNADQKDATVSVNGEKNASGTMHDIPSQTDCGTCHGAMKDKVLGFTAIQLSHSIAGSINLDQVVTNGWLSNNPTGKFVVPGNDLAKAALGYLHANCGLCHNNLSKPGIILGAEMWMHTDHLATVADTSTYTTMVNQDTKGGISNLGKRIVPGNPAKSAVVEVMSVREMLSPEGGESRQMPPLATKLVDTTGVNAVKAWITDLGAQ
jgi:hypothetical protein